MTKLCLRCNSQLPDPKMLLCPACEAKMRVKREAAGSGRSKAREEISVDLSAPDAIGGNTRASDQPAPQRSRCTICFREFFGTGDYCLDCARNLNKPPEDFEAAKQKSGSDRAYKLLERLAVGVVALLVTTLLVTAGVGNVRKSLEISSLVAQGQEAYQQKNFTLAIQDYNAAIAAGAPDGAVTTQGTKANLLWRISVNQAAIKSHEANRSRPAFSGSANTSYTDQFQAAGLSSAKADEFLQYMNNASNNSAADLSATIPAALGAIKYGHGGRDTYFIVDAITSVESANPGMGCWDIATKAATGQAYADDLGMVRLALLDLKDPQGSNRTNNLQLAMDELARSSTMSPKVFPATPATNTSVNQPQPASQPSEPYQAPQPAYQPSNAPPTPPLPPLPDGSQPVQMYQPNNDAPPPSGGYYGPAPNYQPSNSSPPLPPLPPSGN